MELQLGLSFSMYGIRESGGIANEPSSSPLILTSQNRCTREQPVQFFGYQGVGMECHLHASETMPGTFVVIRIPIGVAELVNSLVEELLWQCSV